MVAFKMFWAISCVVVYFVVMWIVIAAFCVCSGDKFTLSISKIVVYKTVPIPLDSIYFSEEKYFYDKVFSVQMMLLPILVTGALSIMQLALSLIIKPIFSFCISATTLVLSAYYLNPILIGNYVMSERSDLLIENGISTKTGIIYSFVILVAFGLMGLILFWRYDVLSKEE